MRVNFKILQECVENLNELLKDEQYRIWRENGTYKLAVKDSQINGRFDVWDGYDAQSMWFYLKGLIKMGYGIKRGVVKLNYDNV